MLFVSHCIYSHILLLVYLSQTKQCGLFEGFIIHFTAFKAWSKRFDHFTLPQQRPIKPTKTYRSYYKIYGKKYQEISRFQFPIKIPSPNSLSFSYIKT